MMQAVMIFQRMQSKKLIVTLNTTGVVFWLNLSASIKLMK